MISWLLSALLSTAIALGHCSECKPNQLCPKHLEQEQAAIREAKKALESKTPGDRIGALQKVAALDEEHWNSPSKKAAEFLADSLDDESFSVRQVAADLLAETRRPDVAFPALEKAVDAACVEASANVGGGDGRAANVSQEKLQRSQDARTYLVGVCGTVARLRDDRSVRIVVGAFQRYSKVGVDDTTSSLSRLLMALGTRDALEPIVDLIDQNEKRYWKAREDKRPVPPFAAFVETMERSLTSFASTKNIPGAPEWKPGAGAKWRAWLKKNADAIPKSLGTIEVGATPPAKG
jgi:hypothetical protein